MIHLKDSQIIGKGMQRTCYLHPEDDGKCIKIYHKKPKEKLLLKEVKEISRLRRRKHSLIVPQHYGTVDTDKGLGHIFDLVKSDNVTPLDLEDYLLKDDVSGESIKKRLYDELLKSTAIFADLNVRNIMVVEKKRKIKFAIVDGLGEGTFIKIW